jgi:hypothetical protein
MTLRSIVAVIALLSAWGAVVVVKQGRDVQPSAIVSQANAQRQDFDWGTLYTYYNKETYGTTDGLAAVAVIRPGWEIHPPHISTRRRST